MCEMTFKPSSLKVYPYRHQQSVQYCSLRPGPAGCAKVFREKNSGARADRSQLVRLLSRFFRRRFSSSRASCVIEVALVAGNMNIPAHLGVHADPSVMAFMHCFAEVTTR
jgi:hypothetical protein